jgi:crotonobetainyl-CoA:carnitine CoA-transferase CaiB-like acyl-CoA transferase
VLVINVRPGVEDQLGLGAARLQGLNPRLIHCSITGYGADGPYAKRPAFDGVGQTLTGLLSRFHQSEDPRIAGPAMADSLTGIFACLGVLGALHERSRTGSGRKVEVNMIEAAMAFAIEPLAHYLVLGEDQPFYYRGAASQAYILRCKDGRRIGLHMSSPEKFWKGLAAAISRPDLLTRYATRKDKFDHYEDISRELAAVFLTKTREEWIPLLEANDVPFAPEHRLAELEHDPQVRHLGSFNEIRHPQCGATRGVNRPVRFDGDNRSAFLPPPALGEHTDEVLRELGLGAREISELRARGIVQEFPGMRPGNS